MSESKDTQSSAPSDVPVTVTQHTRLHSTPDVRPSTTGSSSQLTDPFASPFSSRPPSIRPSSSKLSVYDTGSAPRSPTDPHHPNSHMPQSILSSPRSTSTSLSARSSAVRFPNVAAQYAIPTTAGKSKLLRMRSTMITSESPAPKPWNDVPNPRAKIAYFVVYFLVLLGVAGGAVQCYFNYKHVALDKQPLCLVMDENFDGSEESVFGQGGSFFREVSMDGWGNGQFEMTTASRNNSFIKDGKLYIVPTLTSDSLGESAVFDGTAYNITGCTFNQTQRDNGFIMRDGQRVFDSDGYYRACSAVSNSTANKIINPVQSARISTRFGANIRYGRVEFKAKMPNGDWMWPAVWMLPKDEEYGPWPTSGEIDIVESRGNGIRYTAHGSNYVQGTLNWGPTPALNAASKSYSWWTERRKSFGSEYRTYALEWTEDFLRIYVDTRLHTLLDMRFNIPFWKRGDFPEYGFNGSNLVALQNPWVNGSNAAPFDKDFYLIMNVAVGGTNGWFPEAQGNKPWLNQANNPMKDFALAQNQWYPTWPSNVEDRAMIVDYVKMWKHC